PVSVRVLSLVTPSPTVPLSVEYEPIAGVAGALASMVTLSALEAALVLPATSVAVAVRLWPPLVSAAVVKLQAPAPLAVADPSRVAPSQTLTVALASALPVRVRVLSLVMPSPTVPLSVEYEPIAGVAGALASMVPLSVEEAALVLPATSVAVAVRLWAPLASAAVVKLQAPAPLAVADPSSVTPS